MSSPNQKQLSTLKKFLHPFIGSAEEEDKNFFENMVIAKTK